MRQIQTVVRRVHEARPRRLGRCASSLPDWLVNRLPVPSITIDEIVGFLIGQGADLGQGQARHVLRPGARLINAADHLPWVDLENFYRQVEALGAVFDIVLTPTPPPPPDVMPKMPLAGFPDVYDAFFGGGKEAALVASVDAFGVEVRGGIRTALGGAATMFERLGTTFAVEADRAASMGSVGRMRELAGRLRRPERARLRPRGRPAARRRGGAAARPARDSPSSRPSPRAGFALVGGAIPAYVGEMRRFWATKRPPVPPPTSPHILARHGRLGGVRVPRITVRASGRVADRQLAALVAARFHDAVGEAYVGGRREFERLGGPPLRRPARSPGRRPVTSRPGVASGS